MAKGAAGGAGWGSSGASESRTDPPAAGSARGGDRGRPAPAGLCGQAVDRGRRSGVRPSAPGTVCFGDSDATQPLAEERRPTAVEFGHLVVGGQARHHSQSAPF